MTGPGYVSVWPGAPRPDVTLERMKEITLREYEDAHVVSTAVDIVDEVNSAAQMNQAYQDNAAMAGALLVWLRTHTRFVPDPVAQQRLSTPVYMLEKIRHAGKTGGDCADLAMLAAALCLAVGMHVKFVAESYATPCDPKNAPLVHVYTAVQTQNGWLALDTQQPADGIPVIPCRRVELDLP